MSSKFLISPGHALTKTGSPTNALSSPPNKSQQCLDDMNRWKFVLNLPLIILDNVAAPHRTCCLCHQEYNRDFQVCGPETAVQLPCGCFLGHLCAAERFSPYRQAQTACPMCKCSIPELAARPLSTMPHDAGLSLPTNLFRTSEWLRAQQIAPVRDEREGEIERQIAALELDTGFCFFEGDGAIETLSATLTDYSQKKENSNGKAEGKIPLVGLRKRVNSDASVESEKRQRVPDFRGRGIARAALKAVDLMAKKSGA